MSPLHAPDAMGQAAHKAAMLATRLDFKLLGASHADASRDKRAESLTAFFRQYRAFARAVAELERTAPTCAEQGYDQDAVAQEFIEGRTA